MKTMSFALTIEVNGFEDPQEAGDWLSEKLNEFYHKNVVNIYDIELDPEVIVTEHERQ